MFKYINKKSNIHQINPTYKIISLLIFFILFLFTDNISFSILMLLFSITLSILTKIDPKLYLYRLIPISILITLIAVFGIISNNNVINLILKLLSFSIYYSSYIFTTKFVDTNKGIFDIFNQFNIRNYKLNLSFTILIHLISIIYEEFFNIKSNNIFYRLYYTIDKVIIRLKQIINLNKVKTYNFNYKEIRDNIVGAISLTSHLLLFTLYFFNKI